MRITIAPDTLISTWNNAALQMIRKTHPGPPITARALAIVHTGIYDAWAAYNPVAAGTRWVQRCAALPMSVRLRISIKRSVMRHIVHLADLFPNGIPQFKAIMQKLGYDPADMSTDISTPCGIGNVAAQAVIGVSCIMMAQINLVTCIVGAYSDYLSYTCQRIPPIASKIPTAWQPLRVSDGIMGGYDTEICNGVLRLYRTLRTDFRFAQFRPGPPATYPSPEYIAQAEQILNYSANLTDGQKVIAEYWADGPSSEQPPGHWNLFAQFVSQRDDYDLDTNVKLFFILTNAIFDAGIAAWDCKLLLQLCTPYYSYTLSL